MKSVRSGRVGVATAAAVAMVMIGSVSGVWAAHSFDDVPNSHPFHAEIGEAASACIAGGFPDGTYRPADGVTRAQMAGFLNRAGSYVAEGRGSSTVVFGSGGGLGPTENITSATISVPNIPGCQQQVVLEGGANLFMNDSVANACDLSDSSVCNAMLSIRRDGSVLAENFIRLNVGAYSGGQVGVQIAVDAAPGNHTYTLDVRGLNIKNDKAYATSGSLLATVVPFGGGPAPAVVGDDTAAVEAGAAP